MHVTLGDCDSDALALLVRLAAPDLHQQTSFRFLDIGNVNATSSERRSAPPNPTEAMPCLLGRRACPAAVATSLNILPTTAGASRTLPLP